MALNHFSGYYIEKMIKKIKDRTPKYLWYYGAAIILVYFVWNYYTAGPLNHFGTSSLDQISYEKAKAFPYANMDWSIDNVVSSVGTKDIASNVNQSMEMISDKLGMPNYHSNSFESSMVNEMGTSNNLMTTPSYQLSKSHILLERQMPEK